MGKLAYEWHFNFYKLTTLIKFFLLCACFVFLPNIKNSLNAMKPDLIYNVPDAYNHTIVQFWLTFFVFSSLNLHCYYIYTRNFFNIGTISSMSISYFFLLPFFFIALFISLYHVNNLFMFTVSTPHMLCYASSFNLYNMIHMLVPYIWY